MKDPEKYIRIIGRLLYLNLTRPKISYSVQQLSQFMQTPRIPHLQVVLHVISYLKGTSDWGLFYSSISDLHLTGFCDTDWGIYAYSGRSLKGYYVFIGETLISWMTKKQKTVSKSSAESEYTASELVCLDVILKDMLGSIPKPIPPFWDNKSAHHIAQNSHSAKSSILREN